MFNSELTTAVTDFERDPRLKHTCTAFPTTVVKKSLTGQEVPAVRDARSE